MKKQGAPKPSPYIEKKDGHTLINDEGYAFLEPFVTNTHEKVYVFTGEMDSATIAAAMARLSRRGDDLRTTLLDEFHDPLSSKDQDLLRRVITAYGDDSVQQLAGAHLVVEDASNLLTKRLEWGRLAAYLEQSTRYIYYDQKDAEGNYRYVVPPEVGDDAEANAFYRQSLDSIFDNYAQIIHQLAETLKIAHPLDDNASKGERIAWNNSIRAQACDVARALLPAATKATVGIFASGQALENMVMRLLGDDLAEARNCGQQILDESRQVLNVFLERADNPARGGATTMYQVLNRQRMRDLAQHHGFDALEENQNPPFARAELVNCNYESELDLVPDMLYEQTHLALSQIKELVADWSEADKLTIFKAYVGERLNRRQKPGRAFEKLLYSWDFISDYGIFRDLQRHRMVSDLTWQRLTPYLGHEVPTAIIENNLTTAFENCFSCSKELYEYLRQRFDSDVAQYAVLFGHNMRWKMTYNAREAFHIHELRTSPQGHPSYRRLVGDMHRQISQIHPHLGEVMSFVNQDEDPALTRLAAERYQQFKLDQLS